MAVNGGTVILAHNLQQIRGLTVYGGLWRLMAARWRCTAVRGKDLRCRSSRKSIPVPQVSLKNIPVAQVLPESIPAMRVWPTGYTCNATQKTTPTCIHICTYPGTLSLSSTICVYMNMLVPPLLPAMRNAPKLKACTYECDHTSNGGAAQHKDLTAESSNFQKENHLGAILPLEILRNAARNPRMHLFVCFDQVHRYTH